MEKTVKNTVEKSVRGATGGGTGSGGTGSNDSPDDEPDVLTHASARSQCLGRGITTLEAAKLASCIASLT